MKFRHYLKIQKYRCGFKINRSRSRSAKRHQPQPQIGVWIRNRFSQKLTISHSHRWHVSLSWSISHHSRWACSVSWFLKKTNNKPKCLIRNRFCQKLTISHHGRWSCSVSWSLKKQIPKKMYNCQSFQSKSYHQSS